MKIFYFHVWKSPLNLPNLAITPSLTLKLLSVVPCNTLIFLNPPGTHRTLKGFSMGDCSAARGSEMILRVHEFEIWKKIFSLKLQSTVFRYLRFRDDVSVHLSGTKDNIASTLKIIIEGYPKDIQFNTETKIFWGKFLNIKI